MSATIQAQAVLPFASSRSEKARVEEMAVKDSAVCHDYKAGDLRSFQAEFLKYLTGRRIHTRHGLRISDRRGSFLSIGKGESPCVHLARSVKFSSQYIYIYRYCVCVRCVYEGR